MIDAGRGVHTEESGEEYECDECQPFQVLEYLAVEADQGGCEEDGEEQGGCEEDGEETD